MFARNPDRRGLYGLAGTMRGVVVVATTVGLLEVWHLFGHAVPNPQLFTALSITYAAFAWGYAGGLSGAAVGVVYAFFFFSTPDGPQLFTATNIAKIAVNLVTLPAIAWLVSTLRFRLTRSIQSQSHAFIDSANTPILGLDQNGVITVWNRNLEELTGRPRNECVGLSVNRVLADEASRDAVEDMFRAIRDGWETPRCSVAFTTRHEGRLELLVNFAPEHGSQGSAAGFLGLGQVMTDRMRSELALQASEARYRAVVEDQNEFIARSLPGTHVLTFVNDAYCRCFGRTRDALIGTNFMDHIPQSEAAEVDALLATLSPENPVVTMEHRVEADGGEVRWQHWSDRAIFDANGEIREIQAVGRDITEEKRARERVRESEARFRDIAESAADWVWETEEDLRFTYMSPNVLQMVGVAPEWHYGKTRRDLIGGDYDPEVWDEHLRMLDERLPFRDFVYLRTGGADPRWLSVSGKPVFDGAGKFCGYRGTGRDITAMKQQEEALRDSERTLRRILDDSPIGVAVVAHRWEGDHVVAKRLFANAALATMFGADSVAVMVDMDISGTWVDRDQLDAANEAMLNGAYLNDFEALRCRPDGTEWWVSLHTRPVRFDGRDCTMVWHFDITGRKVAEAALRESERLYRLVTNSLPVMICYIDAEEHYRFANDTCVNWFGLEREAIVGKHLSEIHPRAYSSMVPYVRAVLAGKTVNYETTATFGDGEVRTVATTYVPHFGPNETVLGWFALTENIADRLQAEAARARLVQAIETIPAVFALFDENDRLVLCNRMYREMYETEAEPIVPGVPFEKLVRAFARETGVGDTPEASEAWVRERLDRRNNPARSLQYLRGDGQWMEVSDYVVDNGLIFTIGQIITERK
jgi:PAS domain S-box-containing protein